MALLPMKDLLQDGKERGYAVGAFNVYDMYSIEAAIEAAEEEQSPVILAGWEGHLKGGRGEMFGAVARIAAGEASVPVALHLDHGASIAWVSRAIGYGFTSVMIDASRLPFEENVEIVRRVVDIAHPLGVTVEAELGRMPTGDEELTDKKREAYFTKTNEAVEFVERTGVDALAVAVGTCHGLYEFEPTLDFGRLSELATKVDACLVLHGGSGTPGLEKTVELGITKINVGTALSVAFTESIEESTKDPELATNAHGMLSAAKEGQKRVIKEWMRLFKSSGRASSHQGDRNL